MLGFAIPDERCVLKCAEATETQFRELQDYQDLLCGISGLKREEVRLTEISWRACAWIGPGRFEEVLQKSTEDFVKAMNQLKHATTHHNEQTSVAGLPGFDLHIKDFHEISQMPPAKFNLKLSQMTSTSKKFASIATRKNAKKNRSA